MRLPSWPTVVQSCGLAYQSLQGADMTCIGYMCADKEVAQLPCWSMGCHAQVHRVLLQHDITHQSSLAEL